MSSRFLIFTILLGYAIFVVAPNSAKAQIAQTDTFQVTLTPKYPGPHEAVTARIKAFTFNEDAANFVWTVNGSVVVSGKGKKDAVFTTGGIGSKTTVAISAQPLELLERVEKTITIYPSSIDVLWHTNTYTPPGYRGKALSTQGAVVQFVAMPLLTAGGVLVHKDSLTYEWLVDEKLLPRASGRGKSTFSFSFGNSPGVESRIKVRISDDTKSAIQEKTLHIQNKNRFVYFYEVDPLRGPLYNNAVLNTLTIPSGKETEIVGEPYYFTAPPRELIFTWRIEHTELASEKERPHILTYRSDPGSRASQLITLVVKNIASIFEHAQESFVIHVE